MRAPRVTTPLVAALLLADCAAAGAGTTSTSHQAATAPATSSGTSSSTTAGTASGPVGRLTPPDDGFWDLVEVATAEAPVTAPDDEDGAAGALARRLRRLDVAGVVRFEEQMIAANRALYRSDVLAAGSLVCGTLYDDDFTDFRSWIVLHGRRVHAAVVADPGALADVPDACGTGEVFADAAYGVYRERTGRELWSDRPDLVMEPDTAPAGSPVGPEEARRRWPRLVRTAA